VETNSLGGREEEDERKSELQSMTLLAGREREIELCQRGIWTRFMFFEHTFVG
jgi:hypothetical protein